MATSLFLVFALACAVMLADGKNIILNKNGCPISPNYNMLLPHENCHQFYQCSNGIRLTHSCPDGLLYNENTSKCDWPQNVICKHKSPPAVEIEYTGNIIDEITSNDNPSEAPRICAALNSEGVLVAHENCNQFYKCATGLPVTLNCPSGLLYNYKHEVCDWPENVVCGERLIPENYPSEGSGNEHDDSPNCDPSNAPAICAEENSEDVLVAHENCNQFYKCSRGYPVELSCPSGLLYNSKVKQCDWAENVKCENRVIPGENDGPGNYDPSEAPKICASETSDGILVAHEKCNQFYKCANGKPVVLVCPSRLFFNPSDNTCDWFNNVDCGQRTIPSENYHTLNMKDSLKKDTDASYSSQASTICSEKYSDDVLLAHDMCNKFYKCAHGEPVELKCPAKLLYNLEEQLCDWPKNVKCENRIIPEEKDDDDDEKDHEEIEEDHKEHEGHSDPSKAPYICSKEDSDGVLIAHEECNHFYKCDNGQPSVMKCPENLMYNPVTRICDWSSNVKCNERNVS